MYVGRTKRCGTLQSEPLHGLVLVSYIATEPLPVLVPEASAASAEDGEVSVYEERSDVERADGPPDPPGMKPACVFALF